MLRSQAASTALGCVLLQYQFALAARLVDKSLNVRQAVTGTFTGVIPGPSEPSSQPITPLPVRVFAEPPPSLDVFPNNSLFTYWRPTAHFIAPNSWQNDPMNMWVQKGADGALQWHVGYQYHHAHVQWGNISQAAAVSSDFLTWKDVGSHQLNPTNIGPTAQYDRLGVFDGTHIPAADGHLGFPSMIYTSVSELPTAWNVPYINGTESQSLVWTEDNGTTWKRFDGNPVIPHPPSDINVTGFRDPFVFRSARFDALFPNTTSSSSVRTPLYLTISSGDRPTVGPRLLLYRQSTIGDLSQWTYLGPIYAPAGNTSFAPWGGNVGFNFEVANVVTLNEQGDASVAPLRAKGARAVADTTTMDFVIAGAQGSRVDHGGNWPLWFGGNIATNGTGAAMNVTFSGVGDWGTAYACLSFLDDSSTFAPRRLMYCWIYEGDNGTNEGLKARGWNGALGTPRELFLKITRNVTSAAEKLTEKGSWTTRTESDGTTSVLTLGQVRAREVKAALRNRSAKKWVENAPTALGNATASNGTFVPFKTQPASCRYEIATSIKFANNATTGSAGIYVLATGNPASPANASLLEYTTITYSLDSETLTVSRGASSLVKNLTQVDDAGKLRLWDVKDEKEPLSLVVNVDGSFVEVYANSQIVISSRAYPWLNASVNAGFFVPPGSSSDGVSFGRTQVWEGLYNAWPQRSPDTSVPLVWDGPNVPWAGQYISYLRKVVGSPLA
ncbi:Arabinanase/levansucrase/invertase [Rickenella mellea]|uniref:Arabinanase/levansucrase/invertase n=1 Tax=Rickenella mellea TaxID=50990 RepID=A0A4Y7QI65_9AGAM|nr:Arabinanase/levansucrase/invertase [Rickenella mellea]